MFSYITQGNNTQSIHDHCGQVGEICHRFKRITLFEYAYFDALSASWPDYEVTEA